MVEKGALHVLVVPTDAGTTSYDDLSIEISVLHDRLATAGRIGGRLICVEALVLVLVPVDHQNREDLLADCRRECLVKSFETAPRLSIASGSSGYIDE